MIIIVGAGAAGLATGYELQQRGVPFRILEQATPGATWGQHYDRLHLHTLKQVSNLPGLPMPAHYPRFPSALQFQAYLHAYAEHFALPIDNDVTVTDAWHDGTAWQLQTSNGPYSATQLVLATGIWNTPYSPTFPGQEEFGGRIEHTWRYRNPQAFVGQRVLVVGVGNSGAEIAADLGEHGVTTGVTVRDGVNIVPHPRSATAMHVLGWLCRHLPEPTVERLLRQARPTFAHLGLPPHVRGHARAYPVVGFALPQTVQAGQVTVLPNIERFVPDGVRFVDGRELPFDTVLLATGYRPTIGFVRAPFALDQHGWPQFDGFRVPGAAGLWTIGFRYPTTEGWLQSLPRQARALAEQLVRPPAPAPAALAASDSPAQP